jgi:hypothetical protein
MPNIRQIDGKAQVVEGWEYEDETPHEGSELRAENGHQALNEKALRIFGINEGNITWAEMSRVRQ